MGSNLFIFLVSWLILIILFVSAADELDRRIAYKLALAMALILTLMFEGPVAW